MASMSCSNSATRALRSGPIYRTRSTVSSSKSTTGAKGGNWDPPQRLLGGRSPASQLQSKWRPSLKTSMSRSAGQARSRRAPCCGPLRLAGSPWPERRCTTKTKLPVSDCKLATTCSWCVAATSFPRSFELSRKAKTVGPLKCPRSARSAVPNSRDPTRRRSCVVPVLTVVVVCAQRSSTTPTGPQWISTVSAK